MLAAATLGLLSLQLQQMASGIHGPQAFVLPWYAVMVAYALAAALPIRLTRRGTDGESLSLFELAVVTAIFYSDHDGLVWGALIGTAVGMLLRRPKALSAIAFRAVQVTFAAQVGLAVYHPVSEGLHSAETRPLIAGLLAVAAARLTYAALDCVAAFVTRSPVPYGSARRLLVISTLQAGVIGSLALIGIVVTFHVPQFSWILLTPFIGTWLAARTYGNDARRLDELELLRSSTLAVHSAGGLDDAMDALLDEVRTAFGAARAEVILIDRPGVADTTYAHASVGIVGEDEIRLTTRPLTEGEEGVVEHLASHGLLHAADQGAWGELVRGIGARHVLAAPMRVRGHLAGVLLVRDPVDELAFSSEQSALLQALAETTSTTLVAARDKDQLAELDDLRDRIRERAQADPLTGLRSRTQLLAELDAILSTGVACAVALLDLDDFRLFNDSLGHEAGDTLLVEVAERISDVLRPDDVVARLFGDEFAVLLPGVADETSLAPIVERLLSHLAQPVRVGPIDLTPSATTGVALSRPDDTAAAMVGRADLAAQAAKDRNRGRWLRYEEWMSQGVSSQLELRQELVHAIRTNSLEVHFQPLHAMDSLDVVGAEALVRWHHPRRGWLSPGVFIPIAEQTGLIEELGQFVLRRSVEQLAVWQQQLGAELVVSINVSATELGSPALVSHVRDVLERTGVDPQLVMLEITERDLMADTEAALARLVELRDLGVRLAIDDFGTGYSSLAYLQLFPIDVLKVAKEFVERTDDPVDGGVVARAVVDLGHALGMRVLAEAVETSEQHAALRALGCEIGQGWLWSRAEPADEFTQRLRTTGWAADATRLFTGRPDTPASRGRAA